MRVASHTIATMRIALCLCLFFLFPALSLRAASAEEDGIRALISSYVDARNQRAPQHLEALFTPDADQLVSTGEWRHGMGELIRGMMASSQHEQAKSSVAITEIRTLDANVAIVDGRYRTTSLDGTARDMWTTFLVKRTPEGWRIAAIRNMKPTAAVQPNR